MGLKACVSCGRCRSGARGEPKPNWLDIDRVACLKVCWRSKGLAPCRNIVAMVCGGEMCRKQLSRTELDAFAKPEVRRHVEAFRVSTINNTTLILR